MALPEAEVEAPTVKLVEQLRVSPPPASVSPTTLPLTFFDVVWLSRLPIQRLFFYNYDGATTDDFLRYHLPNLRRSLSLALQTFFSLTGNLVPSPDTGELVIAYAEGDSVALLVAESDADFGTLVADHTKDVKVLHPFVPPLPVADERGRTPLFAVQVTVFPGAGFCLGMSIHHAVGDGSSTTWFMKSWAAIHRSGGSSSVVQEAPVYDRALFEHLEADKKGILKDLEQLRPQHKAFQELPSEKTTQLGRIVRSTFVLSRDQIDKLRDRITSDTCIRPSTFVVACSYVWVCLTKARGHVDKTVYFIFPADCRTRLDPPVPDAYFGNCIGGVYCEANGAELARETDGLVAASRAIQAGIRALDGRVVVGMREIVPRFGKLLGERVLSISGSPRFRVYETDFGWGPPEKVEVVSIETGGAMSLAESKGGDGGIEIGMVGPESEIELFAALFKEWV